MLTIPNKPFEIAERYIELRKQCRPPSWGDTVILFNELVVGPIVTFFLLFMGNVDPFMIMTTITRAYRAWCDWEEYHSLRSVVQDMFLYMSIHGGPQIRTNDMTYLPYVFADAIVRLSSRRPPQ